MVLQNYWSWRTSIENTEAYSGSISVSGLKKIDGTAISSLSVTATNATTADISMVNRSMVGLSLIFGTDDTAPTAEDYALGASANIGTSGSVTLIYGAENRQIVFAYTITNLDSSAVTIKEVGIRKYLSASATRDSAVLLVREVLSEPIVLEANEVKTFTYTWTMQ